MGHVENEIRCLVLVIFFVQGRDLNLHPLQVAPTLDGGVPAAEQRRAPRSLGCALFCPQECKSINQPKGLRFFKYRTSAN